jgi:phosphoribosylformylglycinamidine synthase PurS subunit
MRFSIKAYITPKRSILDPQGRAIEHSLKSLGFDQIQSARVGKFIALQLEASSPEQACHIANRMCEQLLANTVIEDYRVEVDR